MVARHNPWEWGWGAVEALAVVSAFLAASWAVYLELRADRKRDKETLDREEDRRRRQAAAIAVWPSGGEIPDPVVRPRNVIYRTMTLTNGSNLPITNVFILIRTHDIETYFAPHLQVVEPGAVLTYDLPPDLLYGDTEQPNDVATLRVRFIDANGLRWERDGRGTLKRLET